MIWALLALLGVPIWLVVGALGAILWSRRHVKSQPEVFELRRREAGAEKWPRRSSWGQLVHDVLVVHTGPALVSTSVHGIVSIEPLSERGSAAPFDDAILVRVAFDDGSTCEMACDNSPGRHLEEVLRDPPTSAPLV